MNKLKAGFITAVILVLGGGFAYSLYRYNVWGYYTVAQMIGAYGFVAGGVNLYKWLSKEEQPGTPTTYEEWATQFENK